MGRHGIGERSQCYEALQLDCMMLVKSQSEGGENGGQAHARDVDLWSGVVERIRGNAQSMLYPCAIVCTAQLALLSNAHTYYPVPRRSYAPSPFRSIVQTPFLSCHPPSPPSSPRCTTVYLVDRRLDMLPALLSEQLCSLRQGVERLAVSVIWTLREGSWDVVDVWMGRTIIKSRHQVGVKDAGSELGHEGMIKGQVVTVWLVSQLQARHAACSSCHAACSCSWRNMHVHKLWVQCTAARFPFPLICSLVSAHLAALQMRREVVVSP